MVTNLTLNCIHIRGDITLFEFLFQVQISHPVKLPRQCRNETVRCGVRLPTRGDRESDCNL